MNERPDLDFGYDFGGRMSTTGRLPEWAGKATEWHSLEAQDIENVIILAGFAFDPKDDMTPVEATRIAFCFSVATQDSSLYAKGLGNYLERHGLMRHFKAV